MRQLLLLKVVFTLALVVMLASSCDDLDDEQVYECRPSLFETGVTICEEVDY